MSSVEIVELPDLAATRALGARLAGEATAGTVIGLDGDLGAGKTELVRGFMEAVPGAALDEVASPTFALVHRYEGETPVWHLDLYRLENEGELLAIGAEEYLDPIDEISLVEWASRFEDHLPPTAWRVHLAVLDDGRRRATLRR